MWVTGSRESQRERTLRNTATLRWEDALFECQSLTFNLRKTLNMWMMVNRGMT